jgi:hypothetical protein
VCRDVQAAVLLQFQDNRLNTWTWYCFFHDTVLYCRSFETSCRHVIIHGTGH